MNLIDLFAGLDNDQASPSRLRLPTGTHPATALTLSRRSFLQTLAAAAVPTAPNTGDHGRIKPSIPVPPIDLLRHDGARTTLSAFTLGHATAVQLMFTTCSTICPIQAALFARVQTLIPDMSACGIQLLSISIDPNDDNAKALWAWHHRYHAGTEWLVAAPSPNDTTKVQSFFGQYKPAYADHSTQINIVDRQSRLIWRTNELPTSEEIASILKKI